MAVKLEDSEISPLQSPPTMRLGIDIGSTTAKVVFIHADGEIAFWDYHRHKANIVETLLDMLRNLHKKVGDASLVPICTGSAGMGLAERTGFDFIQEVVASSRAVQFQYPHGKTLLDIGGEDSKIIFFDDNRRPDMRMNGNCAGGTGAFIDQMASLMDVTPSALNDLALEGSHTYPIASRCGVFAKTDIQNLVNCGLPQADIARSVFHAVALQVVNSLAQGHVIRPPVVFVGGPLFYFPALREAFFDVLSLSENETILPKASNVYPAYGGALSLTANTSRHYSLQEIIAIVKQYGAQAHITTHHERLFRNEQELASWNEDKKQYEVPQVPIETADGKDMYLGVDAGSTTTKIVATDDNDHILFLYYANNRGNPVATVREGLRQLRQKLDSQDIHVRIKRSAVTGYGEELIKVAFDIDEGIVETLAHFTAAKRFDPNVSFILDIGGQDMKAMFIQDGTIRNIEVNEACSSGCGSFIETFANSLGYTAEEFGHIACCAEHPVDLGTRCTVFMNSSVKQALRQGGGVEDISAGLAYSVIQNCLYKVLKLSDITELGDKVIAQGGTFKNPAVLRAMEKFLGTNVIRPNQAEFMGAYGAAITARTNTHRHNVSYPHEKHPIFRNAVLAENMEQKTVTCKMCTNHCKVCRIEFPNGRKYHTGNRCDRVFSNSDSSIRPGVNLFTRKYNLLRNYPAQPLEHATLTIGIPMVLNFYAHYPFWATLFNNLGIKVEPSSISANDYLRDGVGTITSDNICFPAKLVHSHILNLIEKKVDHIFYPRVVYEHSQFRDSANHFSCPVVTGYPDIIESTINPEQYGIPLDSPPVNFHDRELLKTACRQYLRQFDVRESAFLKAFSEAEKAMSSYHQSLQQEGRDIITKARVNNELLIVLANRPYHTDPMINHNIPEMIGKMGAHVIPLDALPLADVDVPEALEVVDQWEYSNQLYRAAHWVGKEPNAEYIQLNSFGCGPDAITIDEVKTILKTYGKMPVVLKIDEISSLGSAKLRVRSVIESRTTISLSPARMSRPKTPVFQKKDRHRTIIAPYFSPFYSLFIESLFTPMGYRIETLPPPDKESIRLGLKYANNDICYPATLIIGDVLKAMKSGRYRPEDIAVAITETGGQCRATNYCSLLKKALLNAGYDNIPVIAASLNKNSCNPQPGFSLNRPRVISVAFSALLIVDQLIRMYHATAVREVVAGESLKILKRQLEKTRENMGTLFVKESRVILQDAIEDFNSVKTYSKEYPRAGLVGEIYVKYNPFSNGNIVSKLMKEGIEVTVPPLFNFFIQTLVNLPFNYANHIKKSNSLTRDGLSVLRRIVDDKISKTNELMTNFEQSLEPLHSISKLAKNAEKVINLSNQAGEGWLLPAEVVSMAESGIHNVLSLQPFGCIANHIVAKGISPKVSRLYPELNYLTLDMDAGNSDVNVQNRLAFFIHAAKNSVKSIAI